MKPDIADLVGVYSYKGRKFVVTGGAGFIGSHLIDVLVHLDANVVVVDNVSRGSWRNLQRYGRRVSRFYTSLGSSCDKSRLVAEFRGATVIHLAARVANIEYNRLHHYDMLAANLSINSCVFEAVHESRPEKFVFVSTSCVYPHDVLVPTPESSADRVIDPEETNYGYGLAKHVGEKCTQLIESELGIQSVVVRFFNAFGLRDYYDWATSHVAPALIRGFMEGQDPVVVWGSGKQTRVLVDARDLAVGLLIATEKCSDSSPVNIGHDREISVGDLAQCIKRLTRSDSRITFDETKPEGYTRRCADVKRFCSLSGGWVPDIPLETTLGQMIDERRTVGFPSD